MSQVTTAQLLTVRQVCETTQQSNSTVRHLIRDGVLPAIRLGGSIRIHPDDLEDYLERGRRGELGRHGNADRYAERRQSKAGN